MDVALLKAVDNGGRGGIRTPGGLAPSTVFKTAAFNRSATLPRSDLDSKTNWENQMERGRKLSTQSFSPACLLQEKSEAAQALTRCKPDKQAQKTEAPPSWQASPSASALP